MLMVPGLVMVLFCLRTREYVAPPAHRYSKVAKLDITGDSFSGKDLIPVFGSATWLETETANRPASAL